MLKRALACIQFAALVWGAPPGTTYAQGDQVDIQIGRSIATATGLVVGFEAVLNDSRCPSDVQCVAAGDATVRVSAADKGATVRRFDLHTDEESREATHGRCRLSVVGLKPVPTSTRPVPAKDYVLTLNVACS